MRKLLWALTLILLSCNESSTSSPGKNATSNIVGTWKLISGTLIENGDTVITDYTTNRSFIKIINDTHFSFLHHDLNNGTILLQFSLPAVVHTHWQTAHTPSILNIAVPATGKDIKAKCYLSVASLGIHR